MSLQGEHIITDNHVKWVNWKSTFLCLISLSCFIWLVMLYELTDFRDVASFTFKMSGEQRLVNGSCPGVLHYMRSGTWLTRNLTSQERNEIYNFLRIGRYNLPNGGLSQRPDRKCGNLSYTQNNSMRWFRVLCNSNGSTPCCFNNTCVNKTVNECRGPFTYDFRSRVHAEYSTWKPVDKRCSVKLFNAESACSLLKNSTIFVVGDSLMRGIYIALIQILSGDLQTGALKQDTPKDGKKTCAGMYSFHHKLCSKYLDFEPKPCNGSLKIYFRYYGSAVNGKILKYEVLKLKEKQKSIVFVGIGLWDYYNYDSVIKIYLSPLLRNLRGYSNFSYWPKILWASAHQLGILRYPYVKTVDNLHGKQFNDKMAAYLSNFNVPVFDTFNLTEGVMSTDGTHYGQGVNMLKAQLYFNYMQELKDRKLW